MTVYATASWPDGTTTTNASWAIPVADCTAATTTTTVAEPTTTVDGGKVKDDKVKDDEDAVTTTTVGSARSADACRSSVWRCRSQLG